MPDVSDAAVGDEAAAAALGTASGAAADLSPAGWFRDAWPSRARAMMASALPPSVCSGCQIHMPLP
ncbi:MAG TPA: hypothetical protein VHH09_08245 [Acidimicrobiales bacterium]|nr:hypothetical protein [Acidimicrobiales bacterium]